MSKPLTEDLRQLYLRDGFVKVSQYFSAKEIADIKVVIDEFHQAWLADNQDFYQAKAVNSAYLTSDKYLASQQRNQLFQFIGSNSIKQLIELMPLEKVAFMNSQLFFNPVNPNQANYWHRDPQYHLSVDEQRQVLQGHDVIHCRIALSDEPGIEVIPGTHKRFDNDNELAVRLEQKGKQNSDSLADGLAVPLNKGDVLLFSANMIHRGLYGKDRLALDLLFCEALEEFVAFAEPSCLPNEATCSTLEWPEPFERSLATKQSL
ncbi:phytanoyl-CoA dioxygenase family protein [uncultured Shewanella sp.]|uniref:phytanoyl-CoA dioxygenase family protein n=1 Tax=uncultured Shewanella sp. TaxID=173975 RepID=UPI002625C804|nr:phytanoyl-CoA dioxygenase family protein [uncultured Shewanella sp.]